MEMTYEALAKRIDHSLLPPMLTDAQLAEGCRLAVRYQVASVCIKPYAVPLASALLKGTGVLVGTTVGFPHGGHHTAVKVFEAEREWMRARPSWTWSSTSATRSVTSGTAYADIGAIVKAAHARGAIVKVIFENCYLNDEQKVKLCQICGDVNADYVKTSTGFGTGGATHADLILMRQSAQSHVKLKAAGGVRDLDGALAVSSGMRPDRRESDGRDSRCVERALGAGADCGFTWNRGGRLLSRACSALDVSVRRARGFRSSRRRPRVPPRARHTVR